MDGISINQRGRLARSSDRLAVACVCTWLATVMAIAGPVEDPGTLGPVAVSAVENATRDRPDEQGGGPRDDLTGACCDFSGACSTRAQGDCDLHGGNFLGAGTVCSPNPCPQPIQCQLVGFIWAEQPPPNPLAEPWSTSESDENTGTTASEFFLASGWITDVRWYGLYGTPSGACTRGNDDFIITIFADAAGSGWSPTQPGTRVVAQHTVSAVRVPANAGGDFDGLQLQRFTATLPTRCATLSGWIQIQAASDGTNCRFRWMSSQGGDGSSWANGAAVARDLSFCLEGSDGSDVVGACCDDGLGTCNEAPFAFFGCMGPGFRFTSDVACADVTPPCGGVTGACCDSTDGSCAEVASLTCNSQGGIYHGDMVTCIEVTCPGACCFMAASCEFLDPTDCDNAGGLFMGEETTCASVTCPTCEYCPSSYTDDGTGGDPPDDAIYNVTFGDIDNSTGAELGDFSYGDYLDLSTVVVPGGVYTLFVTADGCNDPGAGQYSQDVWAWIDWNQNCVFDDPGEAYNLGATEGVCDVTLTLDITVPLDAPPGTIVMRVIEEYNSDPGPCDNDGLHGTSYGETEDYTVIVAGAATGACCLPNESCKDRDAENCATSGGVFQGPGVPCATVDCSINGACCDPTDGTCTEVGAGDCATAGGMYHGDHSTCAAVECPGACCLVDASCQGFLTPGDCSNLGGTFQGEETTCTGVTCPGCEYCPSSYTDDGTGGGVPDDAIYNVTFGDIDNTTSAELGNLSYGDYRHISTAVAAGGTYMLSVTADGCNDTGTGSEDVWAWIDWNQNCVFNDPGEAYDLGATGATECNVTLTIPISVPLGAMIGTTAMRVIEEYHSDPGPCDGDGKHATTFGETEDYTIIVTPATGACCLPDWSCQIVLQASCVGAGGDYRGDLTTCDQCDSSTECMTCPADVNGDNVINGLDVALFADCHLGVAPYEPCADMDGDLDVDGVDANTFVTLLVNGTGPCGSLPACTTCAGDASFDGKRNGVDIDVFVRCMLDQAGLCPCADMNGDYDVTFEDIEAFIDAIVNQTGDCP